MAIGTARILSFTGFGMLLVTSFGGARFRAGGFAIGSLFATALMIGLGLAPVLSYFAADEHRPSPRRWLRQGSSSQAWGRERWNPIVSLVIGAMSALLIMVDFKYLRKHGTEDQAVMLATGIFVSIVNIFLALLNVFSNR